MDATSGLSVGVLGPLTLRRDGLPLQLDSARQRTILLRLVVGDQSVSDDRLIDALWGERPPRSARPTLRAHVSRLRTNLGGITDEAPVIVHGSGGYRLAVDHEVDASTFTRLLDSARAAHTTGDRSAALAALETGLGLWRGEPFADVRYEPFAQSEIARLDALRLRALEERAEILLDLGEHHELVPELEALVHDHPLRERLHGLLMLALFRSGRRGDALAAYAGARKTQIRELGLEPSPALQDLHREILEGSVTAARHPAVGRGTRRSDPGDDVMERVWDGVRLTVDLPPLDERVRTELLLARGRALRTAGRVTESRMAFAAAVRLAMGTGSTDELAAAVLGLAGPPEDTVTGLPFDEPLAQTALLRLPEGHPAGIELRARIGMDLSDRGEHVRGEEMIRSAISDARSRSQPEALAYALRALKRSWFDPLALEERLDTSGELVRIGEEHGLPEVISWGNRWRAIDLLELGDLDGVEGALDALERGAETRDAAFHRWGVLVRRAGSALLREPTQKSETIALQAMALTAEVRSELTTVAATMLLWNLRWLQGRIVETHPHVETLAAEQPLIAAMLPFSHVEQGDEASARAALSRVTRDGIGGVLRHDPIQVGRLLVLGLLAETASSLGETDLAGPLYELLAPLSGRFVVWPPGITVLTAVDHCLGRLAATLGEPERAAAHLEDALATYERRGAPTLAPRTQLAYARVLRRSGEEGTGRAEELVRRALDGSAELGLGHPPHLLPLGA